MNFTPAEAIANAVLFEGYLLYPYRPSSIKNRQRWNFGTLYPRALVEARLPDERFRFSAQILFEGNDRTSISARVRLLQLVAANPGEQGWEEGFQRARTCENIALADLVNGVQRVFHLDELAEEELRLVCPGFIPKSRVGRLALRAECLGKGLYRLSARFSNESPVNHVWSSSRRSVQDISFNSAHLLLGIDEGSFHSLLEPPADVKEETQQCEQDGVFPVLAGEPGDRSLVLCSPIILYDYPQVAPESAGDFFDGTEMDEMLALRVLTLSEEEKAEMRSSDARGRAILERTETLPPEHLAKLHGAVRGMHAVSSETDLIHAPFDPFAEKPPLAFVRVSGAELHVGDRVRLWPQNKADILDMAMIGKLATIEAIEQDLEDQIQFAVVLDEDPGRDLGMLRQAGHRFFFRPEEVEPLASEIR